jgi:hypothetical protein
MGTGKTTFSMAFVVAMARLAETHPEMPFGCVLLVDRIVKAEQRFCELSKLLPDRVAVFSGDHDLCCKSPTWLTNPSAQFFVTQLPEYPVLVTTHAFYKGLRGRMAREVVRNGQPASRALTIVDEQMEDVPTYDVLLWQAERVWEHVRQRTRSEQEDAYVHTRDLVRFMRKKAVKEGRGLEKPGDDPDAWKIADELRWFTTETAVRYARSKREQIPGIAEVFGFARSMANGCAFIARYHSGEKGTYFVGYEPQFTIVPGMVLLDATSDLDGVTSLCPWRTHVEVPPARYDNLTIVHVDCYTDERLASYLLNQANRLKYVRWMKEVIKENMGPGQRAVVVCKKILVDEHDIPDWPTGDQRFTEQLKFTEDYGWDVDGRSVSITYWGGNGIGSNVWRDADVVFLFGEFYLPRRAHIGSTQGLQLATTAEGAIVTMPELQSSSQEVDAISEGHLLRWTKQMSLRGKGRFFDKHGVCGEQKVVLAMDYERLLLNKDIMFPGAKFFVSRPRNNDLSRYQRRRQLMEILSDPNCPTPVSTKEIADRMGVKSWGSVSKDVMAGDAIDMVGSLGWTYVSSRGRGGAHFNRIEPQGI